MISTRPHATVVAILALTASAWTSPATDDAPANESDGRFVLHYGAPAEKWETQALPIGNGRLGGVVFGGVTAERVQLNEESLWTGDANPSGDYRAKMAELRERLLGPRIGK